MIAAKKIEFPNNEVAQSHKVNTTGCPSQKSQTLIWRHDSNESGDIAAGAAPRIQKANEAKENEIAKARNFQRSGFKGIEIRLAEGWQN